MQKMFQGKDRMKIPSAGFITEIKAITIRQMAFIGGVKEMAFQLSWGDVLAK